MLKEHEQEYEQGRQDLILVEQGRGLKKKIAELEEEISQHIHQMISQGYIH